MDILSAAVVVLTLAVIALLLVVLALARQVGILFERVAPMGALMTDAGPRIGETSPRFDLTTLDGNSITIGAEKARSTLVFFLSTTCPVCKKLLPVLRSLRQAEGSNLDIVLASDGEQEVHQAFSRSASLADFPYVLSQELGMTYRINRLPFAVVLDPAGIVRGKGLVNSREQLESLLNARDMGQASIQDWFQDQAGSQTVN